VHVHAYDDGGNAWQGGSRTQQTRKNPILSAVNLSVMSVGDANNPGTLGKYNTN
jgi:hypothetical protein